MFSDDLRQFGPDCNTKPLAEAAAFDYCKRLAKKHYENFIVAGWLLPKELRRPFYVIYAYCRWSDDLGDEHDGSSESRKKSLDLFDLYD
jgi:phytoene/squalene synthetase